MRDELRWCPKCGKTASASLQTRTDIEVCPYCGAEFACSLHAMRSLPAELELSRVQFQYMLGGYRNVQLFYRRRKVQE